MSKEISEMIDKVKSVLVESDGKYTDECDFTNHNFNLGDCDIYAIALHRLHGYPLCAIRGKYLESEWGGTREWDYEYCHIMVKLPNGNYLDSQGEQTREEMVSLAAFGEDVKKIEIVDISESEAEDMFSCTNQNKDIARVIKFIKNKK